MVSLFTTFSSITATTDQLLFKENNRYFLRGLTLSDKLTDLSRTIPLCRIISLTLYETGDFEVIEHCSQLRSLKLIGQYKWSTNIIRKVSRLNSKLIQLTVTVPIVESLSDLLGFIQYLSGLRRLEIHTDCFVSDGKTCGFTSVLNEIEQFVLDSCFTTDFSDLFNILPYINYLRLLGISSIGSCQKVDPSFIVDNLRTISLGLLEASFDWILRLLETLSHIVKLQLTGITQEEGFVINQRWCHLFISAPNLLRILVNLYLQQADASYDCEKIQEPLRELNLKLECNDTYDTDCYSYYGPVQHWWTLTGTIYKQ